MRIPAWMITDEMKLTEHYKMYAEVFGIDVPLTHLAEHKSREEQEAKENVALVYEHLAAEEIEKLVEDPENVDDSSPLGMMTHLFPALDVSNIVPPVNVDYEEDEITDEVFELRRRVKEKNVKFICTKVHKNQSSSIIDQGNKPKSIQRYKDFLSANYKDDYANSLVKEKVTEQVKKEVPTQVRDQVPVYVAKGLIMERKTTKEETERLISKGLSYKKWAYYADPLLQQQDIAIWLALQMKFEKTQVPHTACRPFAVRTRDQDNPHDDAHPEGENNAKRQKKVKFCISLFYEKITPLVQSCQRDPEAPALSLINQDLLYLKKGNSGPEKIVLSLHKFPAIVFNDDDIEETDILMVSITEPDYKNLNKNDIEDVPADHE
ncbi:hypothetical protein Tco_1270602 [Tanacetum coccineum]